MCLSICIIGLGIRKEQLKLVKVIYSHMNNDTLTCITGYVFETFKLSHLLSKQKHESNFFFGA